MARQLTGTLNNPDGSALANATFKVVAIRNAPVSVVKESSYTFSTDGTGLYNVTLQNGYYAVLVTQYSAEIRIGEIEITTDAPTTLPALLSS